MRAVLVWGSADGCVVQVFFAVVGPNLQRWRNLGLGSVRGCRCFVIAGVVHDDLYYCRLACLVSLDYCFVMLAPAQFFEVSLPCSRQRFSVVLEIRRIATNWRSLSKWRVVIPLFCWPRVLCCRPGFCRCLGRLFEFGQLVRPSLCRLVAVRCWLSCFVEGGVGVSWVGCRSWSWLWPSQNENSCGVIDLSLVHHGSSCCARATSLAPVLILPTVFHYSLLSFKFCRERNYNNMTRRSSINTVHANIMIRLE